MQTRNRMPSLTAMRAFEALVRQGSVIGAAAELGVTHSAVSHQIKVLEEELGAVLVERQGKGVILSPAGVLLSRSVCSAFDTLRGIRGQLPAAKLLGKLRIGCAPALLASLPVFLSRFIEEYPDVTFQLHSLDAGRTPIDLAISFGECSLAGKRFATLADISYFPVCSPRLANNQSYLRTARDLAGQMLLHEDDGAAWASYFTAAGVPGMQSARNMYFPNAHLAMRGAIEGCGIAIGDRVLAGRELAEGVLLRLFDVEIPTPNPYFVIVCKNGAETLAMEIAQRLLNEFDRDSKTMHSGTDLGRSG